MDKLNPIDQKKLYDILQRYDELIERSDRDKSSIDIEKARELYDLYDAMINVLKSV